MVVLFFTEPCLLVRRAPACTPIIAYGGESGGIRSSCAWMPAATLFYCTALLCEPSAPSALKTPSHRSWLCASQNRGIGRLVGAEEAEGDLGDEGGAVQRN